MWNKIGKAAIWFAVYFVLQNVVSTLYVIGILFSRGISDIPSEPTELMTVVTNIVMETVIPAMIISSVLFILIYVMYRYMKHTPLDIKTASWQKMLFFAGLACIGNVITNLLLNLVIQILPEKWVSSLSTSVGLVSTGQSLWIIILCTGILIPIMEELTFRYGIYGSLSEYNPKMALIVSSIIFGLIHGNIIQIVYAVIIGFILGYVYAKTHNIWYSIVLHAVNNTCSVLVDSFPSTLSYVITIIAIGVVLSVITYIKCPEIKQMFKKTPVECST